jgi:8-hydroxy-5-deazaflavin:NADPH oxidoreductase
VTVTIVGAGNMGRGIGTRLAAAGADVEIVDTDASEAEELAREVSGAAGADGRVSAGDAGEPPRGEVVVLAVYYASAREVVEQYGDALSGKILVDITNPVDVRTFDGLVTPPDSSAAEELAGLAPPGTRVVKAFNTTFASTLVAGEVAGQPLDVFVASDDEDAKATLADLIERSGLRPIDAGPLRRARELERLGFLHMAIQDRLGTGFGSAIKVLS